MHCCRPRATRAVRPVRPHSLGGVGARTGGGFVLVATLVAVAIIALAAAWFASQVDSLRDGAARMQRWAELEKNTFSVRESLMYAAAIGTREEGGVSLEKAVLATDDRLYKLADGIKLRVQDERGLIGINTADDRWLTRLFSSWGIPTERHPSMIDGLKDFIDDDDLKLLNGAERADYLRQGLTPPANDFLRSREQLQDVLSWQPFWQTLAKAEAAGQPGLLQAVIDHFSVARHFGININSAPPLVLASIPGIDPAKVGALVDRRRAAPLRSLADLVPFSNGRLDEDTSGFVGANDWRIRVERPELPFLLECQLTITPGDRERPARVTSCTRQPIRTASQLTDASIRRVLESDRVSLPTTPPDRGTTTRPRTNDELSEQSYEPPEWLGQFAGFAASTPRATPR
jgi:general secretion pathway protein K